MRYLTLGLLALTLGGCSVYAPDAGHEVVLIEKPWFFGHGGVDPVPLTWEGRGDVRPEDFVPADLDDAQDGDVETDRRHQHEHEHHTT